MKLMKYALTLVLINIVSLTSLADSNSASNDAKLALLIADNARLDSVNIEATDTHLKSEEVISGDESSTSIVNVAVGMENQLYIITRDGGGQIRSIVIKNRK